MNKKPLKKSDEIFFYASEFAQCAGQDVIHAFFGRSGGVSSGVYNSLNCGPGSQDDPADVIKNRAIVSETLGCVQDQLLSLHQVHGAKCLYVTEGWGAERPEADAFVTDVPGVALGILTADCAPVLFSGRTADGKSVVGAAHAGWGGAFRGVLESVVEQMGALGVQAETICACIGPCIGQGSYEVGREFFQDFIDTDSDDAEFFKNSDTNGRFMFDLSGYCKKRLHKAGLRQVFVKDLDTYFNEEDFFSYRRATHRGEKDYGRQISTIMIKS